MRPVAPIIGFEDLQARKPRHLEDQEQRQLMTWLQLQHPVAFVFTMHPPNGGARSKAEAGIFKALGVKPGVPDVLCFLPCGPYHGLAIELKEPKSKPSSVSDDQRSWIRLLRNAKWRAEVAPGFEHARQIFTQYLGGKTPEEWVPWAC